jgi:hypothetical protein
MMFFRKIVRKCNGKEYVYLKLIKTYREGGKVKHKVIANLGNINNLTPETVLGLINGLANIYGLQHQYVNPAQKKIIHLPGSAREYEIPSESIRMGAKR